MRLEITRRADLAARALVALVRDGDRAKSAVLAERIGTTPGFLSQVMTPLVQQGWVRSEPGPTGGYVATVDPAEVSVLDVIEAIEGPTDTGRCVLADRTCGGPGGDGPCALHAAWSSARAGLVADLGGRTLAGLVAEASS